MHRRNLVYHCCVSDYICRDFRAFPTQPYPGVHQNDVKVVIDTRPRFIQQDGHSDVVNFQNYDGVHKEIRHVLSFQGHLYKPTLSAGQPEMQAFVDALIRAITVDDAFRNWLRDRAAKLAPEEQADFASLKQELVGAGFIKRN